MSFKSIKPAAPKTTLSDEALRATFASAHMAGMNAADALGIDSNDFSLAMSCGFAWVNLKPTRSKAATIFAMMGAENAFAGKVRHSDYEKCMQLWVSDFRQSEPHKDAYASAFADVLRAAGLNAHSGSRLD